jgi:hypothetical protein
MDDKEAAEVKRTIAVLKQAKNEIDQAIHDLLEGDMMSASFVLDDVTQCVAVASSEIMEHLRGKVPLR